jgi:putative endonuclease
VVKIGELGEKAVIFWLEQKQHKILDHQWRCRWGEIDIIALEKKSLDLVFVEVKTRKSYNWDENGLLAIDYRKQEKIRLVSEIFLSKNTSFINHNCRFDAALVTYRSVAKLSIEDGDFNVNNVLLNGYQFTIHNYIKDAF